MLDATRCVPEKERTVNDSLWKTKVSWSCGAMFMMQDCYYYSFCFCTSEYSVTVRRRIAWRFGERNKVRHDALEAGMPGRHSRVPGFLTRCCTAMAFGRRRFSVKWPDASRALPWDQCSYICSLRIGFELLNVRIGKRRGTSKPLRPNRRSIR